MNFKVIIKSATAKYYSSITKIEVLNMPFIVDIGNDTSICDQLNFVLDAGNPGATYFWQDSSTNQTFAVNNPGTFYVKVTNAAGCSVSDTIHVFQENYPTGYFDMNNWGGYNNPIYTFVAHLQNATSFFWDFGDESPTNTDNPAHHTYIDKGTYTAKLYLFNECGTERILTKKADIKVGIDDISLSDGISIYPNPTKDEITISINNQIIKEISVVDITGKILFSKQVNGSNIQFNIGNLTSGIYTLHIKTNHSNYTKKIIKE